MLLTTALLLGSLASAAVGAATSIGAQALQNQSTKATNEMNKEINASNNAFNAEQAEIERTFNAEQADVNRQFQSAEAQKQRDYETEMSNTAIQRRAADLQAAGFNPALAITSGSASTPGAVAASGSQAIGSKAQSAGMIPMKAMDYSPMAMLSNSLSHAVNSAKDIAWLQQMGKRNPSVIRYLDAATNAVNRGITGANQFSRKSNVLKKSISKAEIVKDLRSAGVKI